MKITPLLYSPAMVKAKIAGLKDVTRRLVKLRDGTLPKSEDVSLHLDDTFDKIMDFSKSFPYWQDVICPYGKPGDLIYGKEPFTITDFTANHIGTFANGFYHADKTEFRCLLTIDEEYKCSLWKKPHSGKSSLFMFRSLARIWDEIVSVRVERLQDITEDDCRREGIETWITQGGKIFSAHDSLSITDPFILAYRSLWDSLNAERAPWHSNPWVWRIETKTCQAP